MNLMNTAKSNANNLLSAVKELIEYAKFNKSFKAKIVGVFPNGKYKISYKNIEYPAKSEYQHNVGDSVWVCAPCNNWNELYIQSGNQSDNAELITQITELNNEITELETEIANLKTQLTQTNSNLAFESWNDATLLEGWTGTFKYAKNGLGQVRVILSLGTGSKVSDGTVIAVLPQGYRPLNPTNVSVPIFKSNVSPYDSSLGMYINPAGSVIIRQPLTSNLPVNNAGAALSANIMYYGI